MSEKDKIKLARSLNDLQPGNTEQPNPEAQSPRDLALRASGITDPLALQSSYYLPGQGAVLNPDYNGPTWINRSPSAHSTGT